MDLTCVEKEVIGLLGSAYFLGFAISSGITPSLADKYGRKKPYQSSLIVQTIAYFVIIMSKDIYLTIGCYLMVGLCAGGRVAIGTNYLSEFIPLKYQNLLMSLLNCGDSTVMIWQSLYYTVIKDWYYLHIYGVCAAALIILII